ncbi:MAG: hypothetical protein FWG50_01100 [Kiritimatiellaeota bacterium]|nr:hypothetical protein [Kiritimatiellota bacterium]
MNRKNVLLALCVPIAVAASAVFADDASQHDSVARKLFLGEKRLQPWADEMEKVTPKTLAEAWDVMEVLLRAERDETVLRLIPRVYELALQEDMRQQSSQLRNRQAQVLEMLCALPPERAKLGIAFCETCATVFERGYSAKSMKTMGWSDAQIMDWVGARCQAALTMESKVTGGDRLFFPFTNSHLHVLWPMTRVASGWLAQYLDLLSKSPKRDEILQRVMDDARQSPDDMKKLVIFLASFAYYYHGLKPQNADWLLETLNRRNAIAAWLIGENVNNVERKDDIKEAFLKRAVSVPLTAGERKAFRLILESNNAMFGGSPNDAELQAMFRVSILDELNHLYLGQKRGDDAQRVMLEARELRKKHKLAEKSFLAGMTQSESGWRVVESEIKEREKQDETKPEYWLERANYYRGRNEWKEEEDALRRALALCDAAELTRDNPIYHRYDQAYQGLFNLLSHTERRAEAIELFKARRTAARNDIGFLTHTYWSDELGWLYQDVKAELEEDLRNAYGWLKTTPKDDSRKYRDRAYNSVLLLSRQPVAAIHFGVMDFENDPFAWDVLTMIAHEYDLSKYVYFLLFPEKSRIAYEYRVNGIQPAVDQRQPHERNHYVGCLLNTNKETPDEKAIQKLKTLVNRNMMSVRQIYQGIYETLGKGTTDYDTLNWFLLAAINQSKHDWEQTPLYPVLISNYIQMGDWRNSEKYIALAGELGSIRGDQLRQAADLAEKAGEPDAARRMRERLANLGIPR